VYFELLLFRLELKAVHVDKPIIHLIAVYLQSWQKITNYVIYSSLPLTIMAATDGPLAPSHLLSLKVMRVSVGYLSIIAVWLLAESRTMVFTAAWTIECMATILLQFSFFLCECLRRSFISKVDKNSVLKAHSSAGISSLQGSIPLPGHPKTLRDLTHASELLTLPSSFGSIQLGETFSSCLCVNNEKQVEIEVTQYKVEMQTVTAKAILYEMDGSDNYLAAGDTLEHIVHHEIKELGQHVLACTITYRLPPNSRSIQGASEDVNDPNLQTFRKFYKFAVGGWTDTNSRSH
jgi:hypothetical protein